MALPFSSMPSSIGLMAASRRGEDLSSVAVPFGQGFERAAIFSLDRIEMRNARTPPPGRLEMLSLVGDGG
jgi:hypothetical protein